MHRHPRRRCGRSSRLHQSKGLWSHSGHRQTHGSRAGASTTAFHLQGMLADNSRGAQNLATSDHHPFVAAASADGACTLANPARSSKKKAYKVRFAFSLSLSLLWLTGDMYTQGHYYSRVFRLDFNRELGEYRMIDNLHIEVRAPSSRSPSLSPRSLICNPTVQHGHRRDPPTPFKSDGQERVCSDHGRLGAADQCHEGEVAS
jgi:hypothetical protein